MLGQTIGRFSIAHKLAIALASVSAITLAILWLIVAQSLNGLIHQQADAFGETIAKQAANAAAELVLADDMLSLNVIVTQVIEDDNIVSAVIYDTEQRVLAQAGTADPALTFGEPRLEAEQLSDLRSATYKAPIRFQDVVAGHALITVDKTAITHTIEYTLLMMSGAAIVILLLAFAIAYFLGRNLTRPVSHLITATHEISQGQLDYRFDVNRSDEIGTLMHSFNEMAEGLKERNFIRDTFHRYVPEQVATNILAENSPSVPMQSVNASVLFIDMVSFTPLCEKLPPETVGELLNRYYFFVQQASKLYNGVVDKFIGDGVMILFGAPQRDEEHSFHAICCAQLFLRLAEHFDLLFEEVEQKIEFRLGLHCGDMIAGSLGSSDRMQYTVVGDTVNVAARLCSSAHTSKLLISSSAYFQAGGEEKLSITAEQPVRVKGKSTHVDTYEVSSVNTPYADLIERQARHLLATETNTT